MRKYNTQHQPNPIPDPPSHPELINPSDSKKYLEMVKNIQPGINTQVHGAVADMVKAARWEGLMCHLGKRYCVNKMGEFYLNMRITKGLNGILHFTTIVDKKPIMIDHKTINKALHLPTVLTDEPCLDIYSYFLFNKGEYNAMLSVLCESDVPLCLCDNNCGIHYKQFSPKFQMLALILRANIIPKPNQSKYFDFFDIKVLYLLSFNKIKFSISYVILLNMINENLIDYMPYGLLIASIFEIFHITMHTNSTYIADSHITPTHTRAQVPLMYCEPQAPIPIVLPKIIHKENVFLADLNSVQMMIREQNIELRKLKSENEDIKARLGFTEGLAASTIGHYGSRDMEIVNSYQVHLVEDVGLVNELGNVNVGLGGLDENGLPDLVGEYGFVDAMKNVTA